MNINVTELETSNHVNKYFIHDGSKGDGSWIGTIVIKSGHSNGTVIYSPETCDRQVGYYSEGFHFEGGYWKPFYGTIEINP